MTLVVILLLVGVVIRRTRRSHDPDLPAPMSETWIKGFLYRDGKE